MLQNDSKNKNYIFSYADYCKNNISKNIAIMKVYGIFLRKMPPLTPGL